MRFPQQSFASLGKCFLETYTKVRVVSSEDIELLSLRSKLAPADIYEICSHHEKVYLHKYSALQLRNVDISWLSSSNESVPSDDSVTLNTGADEVLQVLHQSPVKLGGLSSPKRFTKAQSKYRTASTVLKRKLEESTTLHLGICRSLTQRKPRGMLKNVLCTKD
ncbi:hypothetical protein EMCRGX_G024341 [Ephydatia muelleri]